MSLISVLSTTDILENIISIITPTIISIITNKYSNKSESNIEKLLDCIDETQKTFSQNYDGQYTSNLTNLFGQVVNAYADVENDAYKIDEIIAGFIKTSFDVDPTDKMVELWKNCFTETIKGGKYANLISYAKKGNTGLLIKNEQDFYNINIFLSYCWEDEKKADEIDLFFKHIGINIRRDKKSIEQWGSIRAFMESIQESDYAILILSDGYLKSVNCMYEITQLMKDVNYRNRIFPVVLDNGIYQLNRRIDYIVYWEEKYDQIKKQIARVKNIENAGNLSREVHQIREISYTIGEFLDIIKDMNNPQTEGINQAIYERLCEKGLIKNN